MNLCLFQRYPEKQVDRDVEPVHCREVPLLSAAGYLDCVLFFPAAASCGHIQHHREVSLLQNLHQPLCLVPGPEEMEVQPMLSGQWRYERGKGRWVFTERAAVSQTLQGTHECSKLTTSWTVTLLNSKTSFKRKPVWKLQSSSFIYIKLKKMFCFSGHYITT